MQLSLNCQSGEAILALAGHCPSGQSEQRLETQLSGTETSSSRIGGTILKQSSNSKGTGKRQQQEDVAITLRSQWCIGRCRGPGG